MTGQSRAHDEAEAPYVTPVIARLANDRGVDLMEVHGTGPDGRIEPTDVLEAARPTPKTFRNQQGAP